MQQHELQSYDILTHVNMEPAFLIKWEWHLEKKHFEQMDIPLVIKSLLV